MILKIVISSVLALSAVNALAGSMYIYKNKEGQVIKLTNVNPTGNFDKFTKKVKVTYSDGSYVTPKKIDKNVYLAMADNDDSQVYGENKSSQKQADSKEQNVSHGTSSNSNSASYTNSAYRALR